MKCYHQVKKYGIGAASGLAAMATTSAVYAQTTFVVPDVDTGILNSAGVKIFAALAIFVAIGFGIRMFRRG